MKDVTNRMTIPCRPEMLGVYLLFVPSRAEHLAMVVDVLDFNKNIGFLAGNQLFDCSGQRSGGGGGGGRCEQNKPFPLICVNLLVVPHQV